MSKASERLPFSGRLRLPPGHLFGLCEFLRGFGRSLILALLLMAGCTNDEPAKTSLFEDDHVVAAHWPADMQDLSTKLRERIEKLDATRREPRSPDQANATVFNEIKDLVGWTAEIAADTNLSEADWMPIYEKSESITANMRTSGGSLSDADRMQIESLCKLIDEAIPKIPELLFNLKAKDL